MRGKRAKEIRRLARSATQMRDFNRSHEEKRLYKRIKSIVSKVGAKKLSE